MSEFAWQTAAHDAGPITPPAVRLVQVAPAELYTNIVLRWRSRPTRWVAVFRTPEWGRAATGSTPRWSSDITLLEEPDLELLKASILAQLRLGAFGPGVQRGDVLYFVPTYQPTDAEDR